MKHQLLALALAAGCLLHAQALEPGKSQTLTSPNQVPEGLSAADWSSIRSAYSAGHARKVANVIKQQMYLKESSIEEESYFGRSVGVSGDTVVVGAPLDFSAAPGVTSVPNEAVYNTGSAVVFVRSNGIWSQQAYLKASSAEDRLGFGWSVAISGDTIIVGAPSESSTAVGVNGSGQVNYSAISSGAAYIFTRSGGTWGQQAYLKATINRPLNRFGHSVAVSGETVVVGAPAEPSAAVGVNGNQADNSAPESGAAYVFTRSGGTWSQQAYLKASNTEKTDNFGCSVAVSGETIIVGANRESSSTTGVNGNQANNRAGNSGAAYVFTRSGGSWSQQAYLKASNTEADDYFGDSVAISGDTVVVGARSEDSNALGVNGNQADNSIGSAGAAYVFERSGGIWSQQAYLKASNTEAIDSFAWSVAISGDTVVVGAFQESSNALGVDGNQADNSARGSGAAYVFTRSVGIWSQQAYLKASNTGVGDFFGISVAVSGDTVVVGAEGEDSSTTGVNSASNELAGDSGSAYAFARSSGTWSQQAYFKAIDTEARFQIRVKVKKEKFGKVTGVGSFVNGSTVTLKAKAKKGRAFVGWFEKKKLITKKKVLVIKNLTADRSLVAKFK